VIHKTAGGYKEKVGGTRTNGRAELGFDTLWWERETAPITGVNMSLATQQRCQLCGERFEGPRKASCPGCASDIVTPNSRKTLQVQVLEAEAIESARSRIESECARLLPARLGGYGSVGHTGGKRQGARSVSQSVAAIRNSRLPGWDRPNTHLWTCTAAWVMTAPARIAEAEQAWSVLGSRSADQARSQRWGPGLSVFWQGSIEWQACRFRKRDR